MASAQKRVEAVSVKKFLNPVAIVGLDARVGSHRRPILPAMKSIHHYQLVGGNFGTLVRLCYK